MLGTYSCVLQKQYQWVIERIVLQPLEMTANLLAAYRHLQQQQQCQGQSLDT
jgi:hypothetical protein